MKVEEVEIRVVPQQPKTEEINRLDSPKFYSDSRVNVVEENTIEINGSMTNNNVESGEGISNNGFTSAAKENQIVPQCENVNSDCSDDSIEKELCLRSPSLKDDEYEGGSNDILESGSSDITASVEYRNNDVAETFEQQSRTPFVTECSIAETICESLLDAVDKEPMKSDVLNDENDTVSEKYRFPVNCLTKSAIFDSYFESIENEERSKGERESTDAESPLKTKDSMRSPSLESVDIEKKSPQDGSVMTDSISFDRSPLFSRVSECEELKDYYVIRREISEEAKKKNDLWFDSLSGNLFYLHFFK